MTQTLIKLKELEKGDIFSETSHYIYQQEDSDGMLIFENIASKEKVVLSPQYVESFLRSGDQYHSTQEVGKVDKVWTEDQIKKLPKGEEPIPRVGDVKVEGIRTIFEGISTQEVFTVVFKKQDKPITKTAQRKLRKQQLEDALKKYTTNPTPDTLKVIVEEVQSNPVLDYIEGEDRMLRGYKIQFKSVDGRYSCWDMEEEAVRPVNINTISELIYRGVRYVVK